ncbi:MAG TPA: ACP S-malonyltransferase, partial [Aquificae bacterium]|nr:ACP S-malonyltransferase [Aquificota bacterium]
KVIFEDETMLNNTKYTQPSIFLISAIILNILGLEYTLEKSPSIVAGHSLGEWTATLAGGALTFDDALDLIFYRAKFMDAAAPKGFGGMTALIGPPKLENKYSFYNMVKETLEEENKEVYIANFNAYNQIVISGKLKDLEDIEEVFRKKRVRRIIRLNVSGPFHTPFMKEAADNLRDIMEKRDFKDAFIPIVSNVDASLTAFEMDIKNKLYKQIFSPVNWVKVVEKIKEMGINLLFEIGPKNVLKNLVKKIAPEIEVINIERVKDLEKIGPIIEKINKGE